MTVSKYATAAGKRYESDLMKHMRQLALDVERLRLNGAEDEGDLLLRTHQGKYVLEAKRTKKMDLGGWVKEARVERDNYAKHRDLSLGEVGFVVVHYARGKGVAESYVTMPLSEWLAQVGP